MAYGKPPAIRLCRNPNHPAKRHGHYGFGGAYACSDFNSPLLSEENMGHTENGYIVLYEKPAPVVTPPGHPTQPSPPEEAIVTGPDERGVR